MTLISLVSALGLLLVASTSAQAGSLVAATSAAPALASAGSAPPKLELGLTEVDYAVAIGQPRTAPRALPHDPQEGARSPTLAQYLNAPAPYGKLLPQPIDDRGAGYRIWF